MAATVKVRQIRSTVDTDEGAEMWLPDSDELRGMVAGGYWQVLEERGTAKTRKTEAGDGGTDTP